MKKIFAIVAVVILLVSLSLTACSSAKPCPAYSSVDQTEVKA